MSEITNTSLTEQQLDEILMGVTAGKELPSGYTRINVPLFFLDKVYPNGLPDSIIELSDKDKESPDGYVSLVLPDQIAREVAHQGLTENWGENVLPKGLNHLVQGYLDYAQLLLLDRAVPSIDGFKQAQRRGIYAFQRGKFKVGEEVKAGKYVSAIMELHPHNDGVMYETMVRYVKDIGYTQLPLLEGIGSFGHRNSEEGLSAPRYVQFRFLESLNLFLGEMEGVNFVRTEDDYPEPELLPAKIPYGLLMPTSGVSVGAGSKFLSYNLNELLDYVIEIIDNGSSDRVLIPDLPTGGYIRNNEKAFRKVMETGKGSVELTSKWRVEGKEIIFEELNYYTTTTKVVKEINKLGLSSIKAVKDITSYNEANPSVIIECTDAAYVDYTLKYLLRNTTLNSTTHANMLTVVDRLPRIIGVTEYVNEWLKFRRGVLVKFYTLQLNALKERMETLSFIIDFTSKKEVVKEYIEQSYKGSAFANTYLKEQYPSITKKQMESIGNLKVSSLSEKDSRKTRLDTLKTEYQQVSDIITNPDVQIRRELKEVSAKHKIERKTQVVERDLSFRDTVLYTEEQVEEANKTWFITLKGGFLNKAETKPEEDYTTQRGFVCKDEDYVLVIDAEERIVRVLVGDIPNSTLSNGLFVQAYAGFTVAGEPVKTKLYSKMEKDKVQCLVYRDGYVSVIKHNEWLEAKYVTKITRKGLPQGYGEDLVATLDVTKDHHILQTNKGRISVVSNDFKHKERTARTKLLSGLNKNTTETVVRATSVSTSDLLRLFERSGSNLVDIEKLTSYTDSAIDFDYLDELFSVLIK